MKRKIPTTGRIGRFAKMLAKETNQKTVEKIMKDTDKYEKMNYPEKAGWWNETIKRLEKEVGEKSAVKIMQSCGRMCCGMTSRKRVKQIMSQSKSIKELIDNLNKIGLGGRRLALKDENTITGGYNRCYCGQVKQTKEPFSSLTYCHCSTGWYQQLFGTALGRPVKVEILQSIVCGAKTCEFVIHI
jgi:predicted ArsR family transcriptional regulator